MDRSYTHVVNDSNLLESESRSRALSGSVPKKMKTNRMNRSAFVYKKPTKEQMRKLLDKRKARKEELRHDYSYRSILDRSKTITDLSDIFPGGGSHSGSPDKEPSSLRRSTVAGPLKKREPRLLANKDEVEAVKADHQKWK
mmetsp:Transcript_21517/g.33174  ORF Transcript_21517/g.33174 Transcript_21517/m.33174 type:complete len:141 (-) Transcript_21517:108-530(-)